MTADPNMRETTWATSWVGRQVQFIMPDGAVRPAFITSIVPDDNTASLSVMVEANDPVEAGEEGEPVIRRTHVLMSTDGTPGTWDYPPR